MFIQHLDKYLEGGSYFSLEDFLILLENSNYELNLEEIEKIKNVIKILDFESIESYILWLRNNYSKLTQGDYPVVRTTFGILYQYEKTYILININNKTYDGYNNQLMGIFFYNPFESEEIFNSFKKELKEYFND